MTTRLLTLFVALGLLSACDQGPEKIEESAMTSFEVVEKDAHPILYVSCTTASAPDQISAEMASGFGEIIGFMAQNQVEAAGPPLSIYSSFNETVTAFDVAIPISETDAARIDFDGSVKSGSTPGGKALKAVHTGPYDQLAATYQSLYAHAAAEGLNVGLAWEYYMNDPGETAPEDLVTEVYISLR